MHLHNTTTRFRHRGSPLAARILHAPPEDSSSPPCTENLCDLTEDDIFSSGDFPQRGNQSFSPPENSGILAALPAAVSDVPNGLINSRRLTAATSISSSSSSSARMIPLVPRPPKRLLPQASSVKYPQSAPVNVPVWARRGRGEAESEGKEEEEDEEERLPPHEILARRETPRVACSVYEGIGRTLKGRDLRQVRNAVWRKTGFLD